MAKKFEIRNSTVEFLTFVAEGKEQGVQVYIKMKRYGQHRKQWQCSLIAQQIISDCIWRTYSRVENLLKIQLPRKTRQLPQMVRITWRSSTTSMQSFLLVIVSTLSVLHSSVNGKPKTKVEPQMKVIARCFEKPIIEQKEIDNRRRLPRFSLSRLLVLLLLFPTDF